MAAAAFGQCYAVIGIAGGRGAAPRSITAPGRVDLQKGQPMGSGSRRVMPASISAACDDRTASIVVNGHVVTMADSAIALATIGEDGEVIAETEVAPEGFQVPFAWQVEPVYRIGEPRRCVSISDAPTDVTDQASQAGLAIHLPPAVRMRLYIGAAERLQPRYGHANRGEIPFQVREPDQAEVHRAIQAAAGGPPGEGHWVQIDVGPWPGYGSDVIDLVLGAPARLAVASLDRASAGADACALTLGDHAVLSGAIMGFERLVVDESRDELIGDGWRDLDQDGSGPFRWTSAEGAHLLVPLSDPAAMRLTILAQPRKDAGPSDALGLAVNGRRFPGQPLLGGWHAYDWVVPAEIWRRGLNDLVVQTQAGAALREVDLRRLGSEHPAGADARPDSEAARPAVAQRERVRAER
jgi:hypothetical protein